MFEVLEFSCKLIIGLHQEETMNFAVALELFEILLTNSFDTAYVWLYFEKYWLAALFYNLKCSTYIYSMMQNKLHLMLCIFRLLCGEL